MSKKIYIIAIFILAAASLFVLSACEKKDNGTETTQKRIKMILELLMSSILYLEKLP